MTILQRSRAPVTSVTFKGCVLGRKGWIDTLAQCLRYPGAFWITGQFSDIS